MRNLETFRCYLVNIVFIGSFLESAASKPKSSFQDIKVCRGSNTGLHHTHAGQPWDRYLSYVERYGCCTTIEENVEIVFLDGEHNYDMSFLESIHVVNGYVLIYGNFFDTLPLKNLRLIRGRSLYTPARDNNSYSLYVSTNYKNGTTNRGLKEIHLTSLHEILNGEVLFERNNLLCHAQTVNWDDILQRRTTPTFKPLPEGIYQRQCEECHSSCTFKNNTRYCWGPTADLCQRITSLVCASNCEERCFGPEPTQCCDSQCAGGCGRDKYDCWACRYFTNYGECVDKCPGEKIYNVKTYKYEDNPNVRYIYGTNCVKECPKAMLIENGACVSKCSEGFASGEDKKCKRCENGVCPKLCYSIYDYISMNNVANFAGCTIIEGSLLFAKNTFDPEQPDSIQNMSVLNAFENVQEISGYLIVQGNHPNFTSLSFLRNLRVVYGRQLLRKSSMSIGRTSLEELGLSSLREISNGDVMIAFNNRLQSLSLVSLEKVGQGSVAVVQNPQLCYADTINWTQIVTGSEKKFTVRQNANLTEYCEPNGFVCSAQCSPVDGCWGQTDNDCRSCAHYRFDQTCVSSCDFQVGLYPETINGTKECRRCHEQCRDNCTGEGSDGCLACKNFKDGHHCIEECPPMKYVSSTGTCEPCYEHCKGGCSGNGTFLGLGGCSDCHLMIDLENGKNKCLAANSVCPKKFYYVEARYFIDAKNISYFVKACRPCDSECLTCSSAGTSQRRDGCKCINFIHDDHCVTNCPPAHYYDDTRQCLKCHHECRECYGPTASECSLCMNYRLYEDGDSSTEKHESVKQTSSNKDQNLNDTAFEMSKKRFTCANRCPVWFNVQEKISVGNHSEIACKQEARNYKEVTTIVLPVVVCVIVVGVIAIVVVFLKRQLAKSEENKLRIAARMNGLDVEEIITPTDAKPDASTLRLIKESDLRRGSVIGSGAFGTVFKGIWIPAGENVKIPVAIKVLTESSNASLNVELLEEARIMASVNHPCCIRILAVCMTAQMMLVTQLMPHGSLLDYLRKNKSNIGSSSLLKWSAQVARGMKYLEERGIVHRDLAARNVLVQGPGQVRITDFGLAKLLNYNEEQYQATNEKMPFKWLALESIKQRIFTHKSDVWSYVVTLWELFTYGDRPYEGIRVFEMAHHLEMGERLCQPSICTIDVYMIMIKCWMVDADSRPTFHELELEFSNMTKDPGRYLVIQGDRFMRLHIVSEDSNLTDWSKELNIPDEEGPEILMTADEYLRPQDLECPQNLQNMSNVKKVSNYAYNFKRPLSTDTNSPVANKNVDPTEKEAAFLTGEAAYLQLRSSGLMATCPNYLEVVDDTKEQQELHRYSDNYNYLDMASKTSLSDNGNNNANI